MTPVRVSEGSSPILLTFPHGGRDISGDIDYRLNPRGRERADTDWHIFRLYEGVLEIATTIEATFHRYVIDANRDPGGESLYPGQNTTDLCPLTDFDGKDIWREGQEPTAEDIEARRKKYHTRYHRAVAGQLERIKARHGVAVLYDCHSIRSHVPHLFAGTLPDFNIGTNDGQSCASIIEDTAVSICSGAGEFSHVLNGRFKGGWTTRHYGQPDRRVHAVQMELAQSTYMTEHSPWTFDEARADRLRPVLKTLLTRLEALALEGLL